MMYPMNNFGIEKIKSALFLKVNGGMLKYFGKEVQKMTEGYG
jgi:hypothetical protein